MQDFDLKWVGRVEVKATSMSQHLCKYDDAAGKPAVSHMWGSNAAGISDTPRDALAYGALMGGHASKHLQNARQLPTLLPYMKRRFGLRMD